MSTATALQPEIDDERLYRIGEVSRLSDLKPFVLRYWETEFPMLEPVKSPSGHRMYRQQDVDMVFKIKRLLYDEGFTIAGARRFGLRCRFSRRKLERLLRNHIRARSSRRCGSQRRACRAPCHHRKRRRTPESQDAAR